MKKTGIIGVMISVVSLFVVGQVLAQQGMGRRGSGGWGPGTNYGKMYNPMTVETIAGEVEKVDEFTPAQGMHQGVHLTLKTEKEVISVHMGPAWYMENQDIRIEPKDKIEVKGSRITFEGKPAIVAAEVHKGDHVLKLRDENGFPVWSGWRRR